MLAASVRPRLAAVARSLLDEGRLVVRVFLLLLDCFFLLRSVLWFLLVFFRGLMGHNSLLLFAQTMAHYHYRLKPFQVEGWGN